MEAKLYAYSLLGHYECSGHTVHTLTQQLVRDLKGVEHACKV